MVHKELLKLFKTVPEVELWSELEAAFVRAGETPRPDWELPVRANLSMGGNKHEAMYVAVSVACLQLSIMLVDDILDDDPRGAHVLIGAGNASNMALAYQSAAVRLLQLSPIKPAVKDKLVGILSQAALATAVGQNMDIQNLSTEEDYWHVVEAKSTPFYGACLELGAVSAGASPGLAAEFHRLGKIIGEIIQLEDDLDDALAIPANADWQKGRNNLLILYAKTADHRNRDQFHRIASDVSAPDNLREAQRILVSSGAVSYCTYHLIQRYGAANRLIANLSLPHASHIEELFDLYAEKLLELLRITGTNLSKSDLL